MELCSCMAAGVQTEFDELLKRSRSPAAFPHVYSDPVTQTGQGLVDVVACFCAFSDLTKQNYTDRQKIRIISNNYGVQLARVKMTLRTDDPGILSVNGIDLSKGHEELFEVPPRCPGPIRHGERERVIPFRIGRAAHVNKAYVRVEVNRQVLDGTDFRDYGSPTQIYAQMAFSK